MIVSESGTIYALGVQGTRDYSTVTTDESSPEEVGISLFSKPRPELQDSSSFIAQLDEDGRVLRTFARGGLFASLGGVQPAPGGGFYGSRFVGETFEVVRLLDDLTVDPTFATVRVTDVEGDDFERFRYDVDSNGGVVVAELGSRVSGETFEALARITRFGEGGGAALDTFLIDEASLPTFVLGTDPRGVEFVRRLNSFLDFAARDDGGFLLVSEGRNTARDGSPVDIWVQSPGGAVLSFNAAGELDTSFGQDGIVITPGDEFAGSFGGFAASDDGRFAVLNSQDDGEGTLSYFAANGTLQSEQRLSSAAQRGPRGERLEWSSSYIFAIDLKVGAQGAVAIINYDDTTYRGADEAYLEGPLNGLQAVVGTDGSGDFKFGYDLLAPDDAYGLTIGPDGAIYVVGLRDELGTFEANGQTYVSSVETFATVTRFDQPEAEPPVDEADYQQVDGLVTIEAAGERSVGQQGAGPSWTVIDDANAIGGKAVAATPNSGFNSGDQLTGQRLDYKVEFAEAGTHYVWLRLAGSSYTDDSVHVGLNASAATLGGYGMSPGGPELADGRYHWNGTVESAGRRVTINVPSAGVHTLNLWVREDGVRVDEIRISRSATYDPSAEVGASRPFDQDGSPLAIEFDASRDAGIVDRVLVSESAGGPIWLVGRAGNADQSLDGSVRAYDSTVALRSPLADTLAYAAEIDVSGNVLRIVRLDGDRDAFAASGGYKPAPGGGFFGVGRDGTTYILRKFTDELLVDDAFAAVEISADAIESYYDGFGYDVTPGGGVVVGTFTGGRRFASDEGDSVAALAVYDDAGVLSRSRIIRESDLDLPPLSYYATEGIASFEGVAALDSGSFYLISEAHIGDPDRYDTPDQSGHSGAAVKLNADFSVDTTWANNGWVASPGDDLGFSSLLTYAVDGDGRIAFWNSLDDSVAQYAVRDRDGSLVESGSDQRVGGWRSSTSSPIASPMRFDADGNLDWIHWTQLEQYGGQADITVVGNVFTSLRGLGGQVQTNNLQPAVARDFAYLPDGSVLVVGYFETVDFEPWRDSDDVYLIFDVDQSAGIWRFDNADGEFDSGLRDAVVDVAAGKVADLAATGDFYNYVDANGDVSSVGDGAWTTGYTPGLIQAAADLLRTRGRTQEAQELTAAGADQALRSFNASPAREDVGHRVLPAIDSWSTLGLKADAVNGEIAERVAFRDGSWNETVGAWPGLWRSKPGQVGVLLDQLNFLSLAKRQAIAAERAGDDALAASLNARIVRHARLVAEHHVRDDGSTYHWAYFDAATGDFVNGETYQGLADDSTWARGQAWAMLGFAQLLEYRNPSAYGGSGAYGDPAFRGEMLEAAMKVSDYYLERLPESGVPLWDFDAPEGDPLDTSSAAIAAYALQLLAKQAQRVNYYDMVRYREAAGRILTALSQRHMAPADAPGILTDASGNVPTGWAVETSLVYADYYFLKAIDLWEDR